MGMRIQYEGLYLDQDDLDKLRRVRSMSVIVDSGNPGLAIEDAQRYLIEEAKFLAELREKYQIPPDESVAFSLLDGMVMETDEET